MTKTNPKKRKSSVRGRRGVFKEWLKPESLLKMEGWARDGLSNKQIAYNIGVSESTFYGWIDKYPEMEHAVKKGKEVVDREVENALLKRALGYDAEETKTYMKEDKNGTKQKHVEKTKKHVAADTTAMIFWLKNRKPQDWNENYKVEHSGEVTNNVNNMQNLSEKDLLNLSKLAGGDDE